MRHWTGAAQEALQNTGVDCCGKRLGSINTPNVELSVSLLGFEPTAERRRKKQYEQGYRSAVSRGASYEKKDHALQAAPGTMEKIYR